MEVRRLLLDMIRSAEDLRGLSYGELDTLCGEIRGFLVENLARGGGHLASNLGAVELTVALHRIYHLERDRLVFDVGHQCYTHKILTGRREGFRHFRELGSISGFPKPRESVCDAFIAGHASNSVSVALGMARARTLRGEDYEVAAVIGDGALSGGLAFEGLSNAGHSGEPLVVVLNDNGMSIDRGVGGVADMLSRMRTKPEYARFKRWYRSVAGPGLYGFTHEVKRWLKDRIIPDNMFDDLGFDYMGPMDGHDIRKIELALRWAREQRKPCLVHVITQKGRGYPPAEARPGLFHGIGPYDPETGVPRERGEDFSAVFGAELCALAGADSRVAALTAAMADGTGLTRFQAAFPDRFFDVGIAEEHACAMAGGLAAQGMVPVFAVYSTFLQRGYDNLIHDISLMGLHVVLAVDRAGIVGLDGQTHQGAFDVAYLGSVPGMTVYAPASFAELRACLRRAVLAETGPVAVRYPRGGQGRYTLDRAAEPACVLREGTDVTLVSYGIQICEVLDAADILAGAGIEAEVVKITRLAPLDITVPAASARKTGALLVAEDVCRAGGLGERLAAALAEAGVRTDICVLMNLGSGILENGRPAELRGKTGLDGAGIAAAVTERLHGKDKTGSASV